MIALAQQSSPWEPYGQTKKKPVVPEASTYGLILMLVVVGVYLWFRCRRK